MVNDPGWYTRYTKKPVQAVRPEQPIQLGLNGVGPAHLTTAERALQFITGGNATFTLRSRATGQHYTYRVRQSKPDPKRATAYFVQLLSGPDNINDYVYLGMLTAGYQRNGPNDGFLHFVLTRASKMKIDSPPVRAISWTIEKLIRKIHPDNLEIWHAGRCGRCGRTLTVPESVASGFGPECIQHIA